MEVVIIKYGTTTRSHDFGFVVFADLTIDGKVVLDNHIIDGRMVEAKKAIPRDDQQHMNKNSKHCPCNSQSS